MLGVEKIPHTNFADSFGHCCILFCVFEVYYPSPFHWTAQDGWDGEEHQGFFSARTRDGAAFVSEGFVKMFGLKKQCRSVCIDCEVGFFTRIRIFEVAPVIPHVFDFDKLRGNFPD